MLSDRRVPTILPSGDVDALRTFSEGTLGFEPLAVRPGAVFYRCGEGTIFGISRSGGRANGTHTQMSFPVPDVAAEVAQLRYRGVTFEEYETPKTENGIAQMPAGRGAWFKDPDGNLLGIFEFTDAV